MLALLRSPKAWAVVAVVGVIGVQYARIQFAQAENEALSLRVDALSVQLSSASEAASANEAALMAVRTNAREAGEAHRALLQREREEGVRLNEEMAWIKRQLADAGSGDSCHVPVTVTERLREPY
ncbi:hypothetical protein [Enterovibrio sp. 27052020O]|uniref:hypothetical protein n=1 Tax=Enterovibrio sp. 27052020O TaxID=3241166 RepID=UPI00388CEFB5